MHSSKVKWKQRTTLKFDVSAQTTLWCKPQPLKIPFVSAYNRRNAEENDLVKMAIVNEVKEIPTWRLELDREGHTVLEGVLSQSEVEVARLVTNHFWSMCQKRIFCSRETLGGWSRKSLGVAVGMACHCCCHNCYCHYIVNLRQLVWEWLEGLGSGLVRDEPETWTDSAWPGGQNFNAKQARWSNIWRLNRPGGQLFGC